jgi:hypothetical protein
MRNAVISRVGKHWLRVDWRRIGAKLTSTQKIKNTLFIIDFYIFSKHKQEFTLGKLATTTMHLNITSTKYLILHYINTDVFCKLRTTL